MMRELTVKQVKAMFNAYDKVHGTKPCTICNRVHDDFENAAHYCECQNPVYWIKPAGVWVCDKCGLPQE